MNTKSAEGSSSVRLPVVLQPGQGREYAMGRIAAVFKADGEETDGKYSISEWWLTQRQRVQAPTPTKKTTSSTSSKEP